MHNLVALPAGDHDLAGLVVDWKIEDVTTDLGPVVTLLASLKSDEMVRGFPSRGSTATTLAIQVDRQAAKLLYKQLGVLGRSMGWLPQQ
jgi:hypothetical protein